MEYVFLMWFLCVVSFVVTAIMGWPLTLVALSGMVFGIAVVMSLVELQDRK